MENLVLQRVQRAINFHKSGAVSERLPYKSETLVRMRINVHNLSTINFRELVSEAQNEAKNMEYIGSHQEHHKL